WPALWFKNVKDYPGQSVFANPLSTWRRTAIALGLPADAHVRDIYRAYEEREPSPIPPVTVESGACQQNVVRGAAVDVADVPAPMIHEGDGGRYIGTWDLLVSRDPESGWTNWGMYRFMVHDGQTLSGWPRSTSHLGKVLLERYVPQRKPMPVALVIGADPLSHLAAAATYMLGGSEASLAGALRRAPVPLCKAVTSDHLVPAAAEMVIEGEILPDSVAMEGPYGEYPGYRTGEMAYGILMQVNAITHRDSPIHTLDCTGFKDDSATVTSFTGAIAIKRRLQRYQLPVADVYVPPEGAVHAAFISVKQGGAGVTQKVLEVLTARRAQLSKIFVVDDDVDVFDMDEVLHAFSTRCHPGRGVFVTRYQGRANGLTPCYSAEERDTLSGATVAFDCTWPPSWDRLNSVPVKATFNNMYSEELRQRVLDRWPGYGLP
ncbi:MAG: UbiD family decarboxylase, partial [Chloroflexota bacterium]|nr:UbiD family decarboxylase [Chloroflexota bacterium]